jgi:6-phosphogluconolactonase/glucosamine-6-phosphate isomerase/deaminase
MTREWLDRIVGGAGRRGLKARGERWLVVVSAGGRSRLEAYRYIYSQLGLATDFQKVVMVLGDEPVLL